MSGRPVWGLELGAYVLLLGVVAMLSSLAGSLQAARAFGPFGVEGLGGPVIGVRILRELAPGHAVVVAGILIAEASRRRGAVLPVSAGAAGAMIAAIFAGFVLATAIGLGTGTLVGSAMAGADARSMLGWLDVGDALAGAARAACGATLLTLLARPMTSRVVEWECGRWQAVLLGWLTAQLVMVVTSRLF